ncbi:hypothetical protein U9M48_022685, partial [Paspalum notatum var. saurae]
MVRMDEAREAERQAILQRERQLRQEQIRLDGKNKQLNRRRENLVAREIELKRREDELKRSQDLLRAAEQRDRTDQGTSSFKGDKKGKNIRFTTPAGRGRGRGRRGNPPHHFVWEGSFGPEEYEPPLEQFPLEGIHTFVGARRLRPYDDRRDEWPKCAHGEHCVVQVFDSWIDGGRRFYRCPNGYDYYDMGSCRFTKWVDPPNHQHIDEYISYLKDRIHDLECKVKSLEEDDEKKTRLVISLEDDPLCPDPFCKCPYHPRSDWPPKSPPSRGHGFYEEGGSSHFSSAHY